MLIVPIIIEKQHNKKRCIHFKSAISYIKQRNPNECVSATIGLNGEFDKLAEVSSFWNSNIKKRLCNMSNHDSWNI